MLEIKQHSVLNLSKKYLLHEINEEAFWLFDLEDGDVFELNASSYSILSCFDGRTPFNLIRDRMVSKYDGADSQEIVRDLKEFVTIMIDGNILESI
jgi:hypothetical protein